MANTYVAIATTTVGAGGAANIDFSSIPATYTDLKIVFSLRSDSSGGYAYTTFNNSGGTAYTNRNIYGFSSAVYSDTGASQAYLQMNAQNSSSQTASAFGSGEIYIPNYTSSNNKSVSNDGVMEGNSTTGITTGLVAGIWANTAAITQVTLKPQAGNFVQYSTATLYGISNA